MQFRTLLRAGSVAFVLGAVASVAGAVPAAAFVACNNDGDCWHTSQRYDTYPAGLSIQFHSDSWRRHHHGNFRWHDRDDDHGYFDHGTWHGFDQDRDHDQR